MTSIWRVRNVQMSRRCCRSKMFKWHMEDLMREKTFILQSGIPSFHVHMYQRYSYWQLMTKATSCFVLGFSNWSYPTNTKILMRIFSAKVMVHLGKCFLWCGLLQDSGLHGMAIKVMIISLLLNVSFRRQNVCVQSVYSWRSWLLIWYWSHNFEWAIWAINCVPATDAFMSTDSHYSLETLTPKLNYWVHDRLVSAAGRCRCQFAPSVCTASIDVGVSTASSSVSFGYILMIICQYLCTSCSVEHLARWKEGKCYRNLIRFDVGY